MDVRLARIVHARASRGRARGRSLLALGALALAVACASRHAERDLDEALALGAQGRAGEAVERLRHVLDEHPSTEAARRARELLPLYEGLVEAGSRYPVRLTVDTLRQVTRAIESYRETEGALPESLGRLSPGYLDGPPEDAWGRELLYSLRGGRYVVTSLGADGAPGGAGEAADVSIADGRLVSGPDWAAW